VTDRVLGHVKDPPFWSPRLVADAVLDWMQIARSVRPG
jgi:hypothetical protein